MKNVSKTILYFLLLSFSIFSISSCDSDDDDIKDIREQATEKYSYTVDMIAYDGLGNTESTTLDGNFAIKPSSSNSTSIEFIENGKVFLTGNKVTEAGNGFSFDLSSQTTEIEGQPVRIEGYNCVNLASVEYNGAYFNSEKKIRMGLKTKYNCIDVKRIFDCYKK